MPCEVHSTGKAARLAASGRPPIPSERPLPRQLKHSSGRLVMVEPDPAAALCEQGTLIGGYPHEAVTAVYEQGTEAANDPEQPMTRLGS